MFDISSWGQRIVDENELKGALALGVCQGEEGRRHDELDRQATDPVQSEASRRRCKTPSAGKPGLPAFTGPEGRYTTFPNDEGGTMPPKAPKKETVRNTATDAGRNRGGVKPAPEATYTFGGDRPPERIPPLMFIGAQSTVGRPSISVP